MAPRRWVRVGSLVALVGGLAGLAVHEIREARATRAVTDTLGRRVRGVESRARSLRDLVGGGRRNPDSTTDRSEPS